MKERVFKKAFKKAELAAMPEKEREVYEHNLHDYWTYLATIETAENKGIAKGFAKGKAEGKAEGRIEGRTEEKLEIARNMKKKGLEATLIAETTGLSLEEIEKLA